MGGDFEFMPDSNGRLQFLMIDKGFKKVNVGTKKSDFVLQKKLGEGHFGSVSLVSSIITNKLYAMKEIKSNRYQSPAQRDEVEKEIKLLENLDHPNVIRYFTSFRDINNTYIITEYINGGSLEKLLKKNIAQRKLIEEKTIWDFLIQSLSGLLYLHDTKKIIHRDIKLDNILIDLNGNLKISDFGVSAIKSEEVEDLVKCHGSIIGPIQFMAPEMALGGTYDFKSDIYMLGLTFFILMSNQMPEKKITIGPMVIPIKNPNAKLPETYSLELRNFIIKLLSPPNERPSTKEAFLEALLCYGSKYLKITSIICAINCFLSIPSISSYFKIDKMKTYLESDKDDDQNYLLSKIFKDALFYAEPTNFNYELIKIECIKLRRILFAKKERYNKCVEIDVIDFIPSLISNLHDELNKEIKNNNEPGDNDINLIENDKEFDPSNEQEVLSNTIKKYSEKYRSKMSEQFFYISKILHECPECKKNIKYSTNIICACIMAPYRAALYLNKTELNIIDLFKHYRKKRLYLNENLNCQYCGKKQKDINRTKIFYISPLNLVLELDYNDQEGNKFKLNIDEVINLNKFIERNDISKVNYRLVGAIFFEKNENENRKYVSITKNQNETWYYFDGESFKQSSLNDLINHNKVQVLFYSAI